MRKKYNQSMKSHPPQRPINTVHIMSRRLVFLHQLTGRAWCQSIVDDCVEEMIAAVFSPGRNRNP